jgi:putative addiction module component (TIGR02574 family)
LAYPNCVLGLDFLDYSSKGYCGSPFYYVVREGKEKEMLPTLDILKSEVGKLSSQERAELAHFLLSSLDPHVDPDAEAAWDAELARREAEIDSGKIIGRPAADVFARLHEKFS